MKRVSIDLTRIRDWESFHDVFAEVLSFPGYYGRNLNAWIDCMGDVTTAEDGILSLELQGAGSLKAACPEIWDALNECAAFVNYRNTVRGEEPILAMSYYM